MEYTPKNRPPEPLAKLPINRFSSFFQACNLHKNDKSTKIAPYNRSETQLMWYKYLSGEYIVL